MPLQAIFGCNYSCFFRVCVRGRGQISEWGLARKFVPRVGQFTREFGLGRFSWGVVTNFLLHRNAFHLAPPFVFHKIGTQTRSCNLEHCHIRLALLRHLTHRHMLSRINENTMSIDLRSLFHYYDMYVDYIMLLWCLLLCQYMSLIRPTKWF